MQLEDGRKKHVMPDLNAGFEELKKGQTVMFSLDSFLRGKKKENPSSVPNIATFGNYKPSYYNMLLTKNSPLVPLFKQASIETIESGQTSRIDAIWKGAEIKFEGGADKIVLSSGQTFLLFIFLLTMFGVSLVCLVFEWCLKIFKRNMGRRGFSF